MISLIDTSVLAGPVDLLSQSQFGDGWVVSVVTIGELETGVLMASDAGVRAARLRRLTAVLAAAPVVGIDRRVASRYSELRAATGRHPANDLWIAATALASGFTLVTADERQAALPLVTSTLLAGEG